MQLKQMRVGMLYVGGFVGPFAAQSLAAVIPDIAVTFDKTVQEAAFAVTAYMIPFATTMLFSTAIVHRFSPHKVVRIAYATTLIGAIICMFAPSWRIFIGGILVMSLSNAFTLPILQVIIREVTHPDKLGGALGRYFAMQSLGNCAAPLVAGFAAIVNWQLFYLAVIAVALAMVVIGVPEIGTLAKNSSTEKVAWPPMIVHILTILAVGMSIIGMGAVLTIHLESVFSMPAAQRGFVIMAGGLAAFFFAGRIGGAVDTYGALRVLTACTLAGAAAIALVPHLGWPVVIALCWAVAFVGAQGIQTTVTYSVLRTPGGTKFNSTVLAFRFFGLALTPVLLLPIYFRNAAAGFAVPAALLIAAMLLQQWQGRKTAA